MNKVKEEGLWIVCNMLLCRFRLDRDMKKGILAFSFSVSYLYRIRLLLVALQNLLGPLWAATCNYSSSLSELLLDYPAEMALKSQ